MHTQLGSFQGQLASAQAQLEHAHDYDAVIAYNNQLRVRLFKNGAAPRGTWEKHPCQTMPAAGGMAFQTHRPLWTGGGEASLPSRRPARKEAGRGRRKGGNAVERRRAAV